MISIQTQIAMVFMCILAGCAQGVRNEAGQLAQGVSRTAEALQLLDETAREAGVDRFTQKYVAEILTNDDTKLELVDPNCINQAEPKVKRFCAIQYTYKLPRSDTVVDAASMLAAQAYLNDTYLTISDIAGAGSMSEVTAAISTASLLGRSAMLSTADAANREFESLKNPDKTCTTEACKEAKELADEASNQAIAAAAGIELSAGFATDYFKWKLEKKRTKGVKKATALLIQFDPKKQSESAVAGLTRHIGAHGDSLLRTLESRWAERLEADVAYLNVVAKEKRVDAGNINLYDAVQLAAFRPVLEASDAYAEFQEAYAQVAASRAVVLALKRLVREDECLVDGGSLVDEKKVCKAPPRKGEDKDAKLRGYEFSALMRRYDPTTRDLHTVAKNPKENRRANVCILDFSRDANQFLNDLVKMRQLMAIRYKLDAHKSE